jgi:hypothetical protein
MKILNRLGRHRAWRYIRLAGAICALPLALWACTSHQLEAPHALPDTQTDDLYAINPIRDIDMLFVVDNSGSTANKQDNFTRNFPAFMNALQRIPGGLPNIRIGVVDNDLGAAGATTMNGCRGFGDGGAFQINNAGGANCGLLPGANWITNDNLVPGRTLPQVFACMATRGTEGCGFEHQLKSADAALHPRPDRNPGNMGFLRPDAYLAIIWLTDEDDCSAADDGAAWFGGPPPMGYVDNARCAWAGHLCNGAPPPAMAFQTPLANCRDNPSPPAGTLIPVQTIVDSIKALKPGHEEKIVVAAIAGWPAPAAEPNATYSMVRSGQGQAQTVDLGRVCTDGGGGTPGLRMKAFLNSFSQNTVQTICQNDYTGALSAIGTLVGSVVSNPCISAPLVDVDTGRTGVQADCVVEETMMGQGGTPLPQCGGANPAKPCWAIAPANNCAISGFQISIDRGGVMPALGIQDSIKCRTCSKPGDPRCHR